MYTQAFFTNISSHISTELKKASVSIYAAVAWLTDQRLFSILCDKAKEGLDVQLLLADDDDNITQTYGVNYRQLELCGGKVYLIDEFATGKLMHNKFCVIDSSTTITGSYNWSNKAAQSNYENITITRDSEKLAVSFIDEFRRIKTQHHGADPLKNFDAEIICKRLLIIDNLIQLEEYDQISLHISKINEYNLTSEVSVIVEIISVSDYQAASISIREYLKRVKSITVFTDEDVERLKWEIKYLETEITALESEKTNILKIIADFIHSYTLAFGDILSKILRLKVEKLKKQGNTRKSEEFEKAQQEYKDFKEQYKKEKEKEVYDLSPEEQEELKKKYRKAAMLCHPDRFTDEEMKTKAQQVFIQLDEAYKKNDLKKVREILGKLEQGIFDIEEPGAINNKSQLLERLNYLRSRLEEIKEELQKLLISKQYRDIISINNMKTFFEEEKVRLEKELNNLENEQ